MGEEQMDLGRTISESLARAGTSVGGASLALSSPSSTSTKRNPSPLSSYLSILHNSTSSCANVSHRREPCHRVPPPFVCPLALCPSRASAMEARMRSKRWRAVMHCAAGMRAWRRWGVCRLMLRRREVVMAVLPVASTPWMVRVRHGAAEGCRRERERS